MLFSPFLIDGLLELFDDFELHHEELLIVGVDEPLGGSLVVEVDWRLLDLLLPLHALLSHRSYLLVLARIAIHQQTVKWVILHKQTRILV